MPFHLKFSQIMFRTLSYSINRGMACDSILQLNNYLNPEVEVFLLPTTLIVDMLAANVRSASNSKDSFQLTRSRTILELFI